MGLSPRESQVVTPSWSRSEAGVTMAQVLCSFQFIAQTGPNLRHTLASLVCFGCSFTACHSLAKFTASPEPYDFRFFPLPLSRFGDFFLFFGIPLLQRRLVVRLGPSTTPSYTLVSPSISHFVSWTAFILRASSWATSRCRSLTLTLPLVRCRPYRI